MLAPTPKYPVKVNGLDFTLSKPRVVASLILRKAYDLGAIPNGISWRGLCLLGMEAGKQLSGDNWVDLEKDNVFLTIHDASTMVATLERICEKMGFYFTAKEIRYVQDGFEI